jgi:hypothetical protein
MKAERAAPLMQGSLGKLKHRDYTQFDDPSLNFDAMQLALPDDGDNLLKIKCLFRRR